MYAIVRAGGRQEKVAVGDVLEIDRVGNEPGASIQLPVLLLVDGASITSDSSMLAKATVTAEVVAATKGPKIDIMKFKNKTGYRKRQGHRQKLTQVKVTEIDSGTGSKVTAEDTTATKKTATAKSAAKPAKSAAKKTTTKSAAKSAAKKTTTKSAAKSAAAAKS